MRNLVLLALLGLSLLILNQCEPNVKKVHTRPNIIFIMTDDHAYQAISAYGSELIETPNIDRLADEGMLFERAFVTNSICSPSRAVALTGKFSHLNGLKDNIDVFDSSQMTFPKLLQEAGYQTAVVGKWHLKSEPTGFDYWKVLPGQGDYYQPAFRTATGTVIDSGYVTDLITDFAIEWIGGAKNKQQPFMIMYNHKAPHREWWPGPEQLKPFSKQKYREPTTLFDDYEGRGRAALEAEMRISIHMGLTNDNKIYPELAQLSNHPDFLPWYEKNFRYNYEKFSPEQRVLWNHVYRPINDEFLRLAPRGEDLTKWKYQRYMQDYLASIQSVDDNIGRLLTYLDESGLSENTLVIYTSDQGFYLGEHGWFDKRFMYEESFRTPLIVRWPGVISSGSVNADLVQNIDFAPTILKAANARVPNEMQGLSLIPVFEETHYNWRDALYYHYYEYPGIHAVKRHYGIRTDRYKLIHFYYDIDEWELYDLEEDPEEMQNVIDHLEYADIKDQLMSELYKLRKQYGDSDELTQKMLEDDLAKEKP